MSSVVITGCGQGLGRATALRLARDGWTVVGVEFDDALAADARDALGPGHDVLAGDVADRAALENAAERARELAPLGGWVNNAALMTRGTLHEPVPAEVERLLAVNVGGVYWGCSAAVRTFLAQDSPGAIVNLSSIHARRAFTAWAAYETSKGAVEALTRYAAVEYGARGIRCNAVAPGVAMSPSVEAFLDAAKDRAAAEALIAKGPPMRRPGRADEVAAVIAFLLSPEASYINGECVAVDGGWAAAGAVEPED